MDKKEEFEVVFSPGIGEVSGGEPLADRARRVWASLSIKQKLMTMLFVGLALGWSGGLFWGWIVDPVEWTNAGYESLTPGRQAEVIRLISWVYAFTGNDGVARSTLGDFPTAKATGCQMIALTGDPDDRTRLLATLHAAGIVCEQQTK